MNCKPNQRAIVTRTAGVPTAVWYLGMVFTVRHVHEVNVLGPVWAVDPDNVHPAARGPRIAGTPVKFVSDVVLTPLPDDPDPVEQDTREIEHV